MWNSPPAMTIEMAADALKAADTKMLASEVRELAAFGDVRMQEVMAALWPLIGSEIDNAFSGLNHDCNVPFASGYLFGLQVARMLLSGSIQLIKAGIDPASLL